MYRLKRSGYEAYLVGGCVRDLLLGNEPKDFDVVTNARPEEVKAIFRNCRLIGRRFRLAHIHFGKDIVEVATFRGSEHGDREVRNGRLVRDNVYGTIEEDVWRRDFTVNALYYNIRDFSVIDYVGGVGDNREGVLRLIGDPRHSFREDPVRMLRAVRFATKLGFEIEPNCKHFLSALSSLLVEIPSARLYDEVLKLFLFGVATQTFEQLRHGRLLEPLFPDVEISFANKCNDFTSTLLSKALENTDRRFVEGKRITPYFLFAAVLWAPLRQLVIERMQRGESEIVAYQESASKIISRQGERTAIPRRVIVRMREIWTLQPRFNKTQGGAPFRVLSNPRFRAAYDFLLLRAASGEIDPRLGEWWTNFQIAPDPKGKRMPGTMKSRSRKRKRVNAAKQRNSPHVSS